MKKTTVYLPDDLKAYIEKMAEEERRSEAEIIRDLDRIVDEVEAAIEAHVEQATRIFVELEPVE